MTPAPADVIFAPIGIHIFERFYCEPPRPFYCSSCGRTWDTLDDALETPCKRAA